MTKTIIVPVNEWDFSERAIPFATALAARADARLVLMTDNAARLIRTAPPHTDLADIAARHGLEDADLRVTNERNVVRSVAEAAYDHPDPVVVVATHAPAGVPGAVIGSYAEGIVRWVAAPVVLVGPAVDPTQTVRLDRLMVCTDGSPASETILPVASAWIDNLGLSASVVEVVSPDAPRMSAESHNDVLESGAARAFAQHLGPEIGWEVLHSNRAADAIVDYAAQESASLIAMATHGRSGVSRVVLGSTTSSVVHNAACPVLVVRAADEGSN